MPSNFRLCVFRTNWKLYHEHRIFMDALWHHISIFAVVNAGKSVKDIPVFPSLGTLGFWEKAGLYRSLSHTEVSSGLRLFAKWGNAVWHIHLYGSCRLWREMCNNFVSSEAKCRLCAMAKQMDFILTWSETASEQQGSCESHRPVMHLQSSGG